MQKHILAWVIKKNNKNNNNQKNLLTFKNGNNLTLLKTKTTAAKQPMALLRFSTLCFGLKISSINRLKLVSFKIQLIALGCVSLSRLSPLKK